MAEIAWTDEAQRWLSDIYDFIATDNPVARRKRPTGSLSAPKFSRLIPRLVTDTSRRREMSGSFYMDTTESPTS